MIALKQSHIQDARAAAAADPNRESVVKVTLVFPGDLPVSYLVRGPVRVELDDQVVEVHATKAGLRTSPYSFPVSEDGLFESAVASAARARTVHERERQVRALIAKIWR